jgi:predicted metal-dependent TIM-barrel fold hydrolase
MTKPSTARPRTRVGLPPLPLFDHHIHSDGRNADDYELMAISGVTTALVPCTAAPEPHPTAAGLAVRFDRLLELEVARAARYGVDLYVGLSVQGAGVDGDTGKAAIAEVADRLVHPRVRALGEVGVRGFTPAEVELLRAQFDLAADRGCPLMIETPPGMADFRRLIDLLHDLLAQSRIDRRRVALMDLDADKLLLARELEVGAYGLPVSPRMDGLFQIRPKLDHREVMTILETTDPRLLMLNTGFHIGSADPLGLARTVHRMRIFGADDSTIRMVAHDNAAAFFGVPG